MSVSSQPSEIRKTPSEGAESRPRAPAATSIDWPLAAVAAAAVGALAFTHGGYFPTAWGWSSLALLWAAGIALFVRSRIDLGRLEAAMLACLGGFTAWIGLSAIWSWSTTRSLLELQRALVYVAGLLAALLLARRRSHPELVTGVAGAVALAAGYALLLRLFPDRYGLPDPELPYRLAEPLGYANALAALVVIGLVLALGLAARARSALVAAIAAAFVVVLALALYLTESRGAWIALAAAIAAMLALEPQRLRLALALFAPAVAASVAVWAAARSDAVTEEGAALADASREGHRLAVVVVVLGLVSAGAIAVLRRRSATVRYDRRTRFLLAAAVLAGVALLAAALVSTGSPSALAERELRALDIEHSRTTRVRLWRAALDDFGAHPVLGSGSGTFEPYWVQHRTAPVGVRYAHSLYLETLAELGLVGFALLLGALLVPVAAALRARRRPLVSAAFGAYVGYLVHAGVDWDWQMPAVTLAGLFCGLALTFAARENDAGKAVSPWTRAAGAAVVAPLAVFAAVGLIGNGALSASADAAAAGDWKTATSEARRATRWAPWSWEAWWRLGEAHLGRGDVEAANASFRRAAAKEPREWQPWFSLARSAKGAERRRARARAARLNPVGAGGPIPR